MKRVIQVMVLCGLGFAASPLYADQLKVQMYHVASGKQGSDMGYVMLKDTQYGLLITPHLHNLKPGLHGFHVHVNGDCSNKGLAAGGHLDTTNTGQHNGPYNRFGHIGDLPVLYVGSNGKANTPVLAPRLTVKALHKHALMVHAGGDNYSDQPNKLGGGGSRVACGVVG